MSATIGLSACADGTEPSAPVAAPSTPTAAAEVASNYRLVNDGRTVIDATKQRFLVDSKLITGYADNATGDGNALSISGWAAPADLTRSADVVVAFVGKRSVAAVAPSLDRPDLVDGYDRPGLAKAGYALSIPKSSLNCGKPDGDLTILALVDKSAGTLKWLGDVPKVVSSAC